MKLLKKTYSYVKSKDELSDPGSSFLHYDGDENQKTLLGGIICIFVQCVIAYIAYNKGKQMLSLEDPTVLSV